MNLLLEAIAWIADPAHWVGTGGIPRRLGQHLLLCLFVVTVATAFAVPMGVLVGHTGRGRGLVVGLSGAARALPTLGLLTLLGLWLGIGLRAPVLALLVLAAPSLLAGAYAGVQSVDARTVDAARAIGMSERQIVWQVELPLGAAVLLGGLRAATLQVVATATVAAYVADTGLGRYLFTGLKTRDYPLMLAGAILVAALALALDGLLALAQRLARRATDPTDGRHRPRRSRTPVPEGLR